MARSLEERVAVISGAGPRFGRGFLEAKSGRVINMASSPLQAASPAQSGYTGSNGERHTGSA